MIVNDLKASILNYAISGLFVKNSSNRTNDELSILLNQKEEQLSKKEVLISSKIMPIKEFPYQIPENWEWVRLGTISRIVSKGTTPQGGKNSYKESGIKFLRAENVKDYKVDEANIQFISEEVHKIFLKRSILEDKDLLICIAGTLGRCGIVSKENLPLNTNQAVAFVRLINNELTNVKYLCYALSSSVIQNLLVEQKKITAIPNLTLEIITNCMIPLPPLEEQNRIVEKIERLFEKLNDIIPLENELTRLKLTISSEIQKSILYDAYSGKWSNDKQLDWKKVTIAEIAEICTGNSISESIKKNRYTNINEGYNYIATKDLEFDHRFNYDNGVKIPYNESGFKYANTDDILMCIEGGSAGKKIGILEEKVCFGNKLCKFSVITSDILPRFLYYYLQSPVFLKNFYGNLSGIIGGVSINKIKKIIIRYPSIEEQQRIVDKIEQLLSLCNDIEKLVNN